METYLDLFKAADVRCDTCLLGSRFVCSRGLSFTSLPVCGVHLLLREA